MLVFKKNVSTKPDTEGIGQLIVSHYKCKYNINMLIFDQHIEDNTNIIIWTKILKFLLMFSLCIVVTILLIALMHSYNIKYQMLMPIFPNIILLI